MRRILLLLISAILIPGTSCSHNYDPDIQNLDFYQWNLWQDTGADPGEIVPSCGWEDLHRGMGRLVRIPAAPGEHFSEDGGKAVYWYHCRFTLPEKWEEKQISLVFEEAGPILHIFLNRELLGSFQNEKGAFELDVSESIYYVRDNHLSIRISNSDGKSPEKLRGITGNILVKPELGAGKEQEAIE